MLYLLSLFQSRTRVKLNGAWRMSALEDPKCTVTCCCRDLASSMGGRGGGREGGREGGSLQ